ncbi:D-alanyl-D-alanine carboxypeptidase/D-alanyl-D-alanine endopeptidase [Thalassococcus sp. BH17M4-6]|uniref:D-alanyl-D-alanine carboxypeptidase/D-alanyl-D-alanine endopeptidase n=1 Tax=Thalassococcus sp. BH17M4-6 TaxID=3413148 RepID=UPI003BD512E2
MTRLVSRRAFLSGVAALAATPAFADPPLTSLRPVARGEDLLLKTLKPVEALIRDARLNGTVGFAVADARDGALLEGHEHATGLPPASVAKALTASYALDVLGPAHQFVTRLLATGPVADGVLQGDLVLAGGGDPTLDTDGLARLAANLKAAGLREVRGRFLVYGGALPFTPVIDPGQPDHVGYNPAVSGLALNYNRVHFEWRRSGKGYAINMDARSETYRPDVAMARMVVVDRKAPLYTYRDAGVRDDWTVAQWALGNGGARWLPVRKPELYAGQVFQTFAGSQGIRLKAPEQIDSLPETTDIAELQSAPLRIILRDMLKWSTNLTAEMVGLSATNAVQGEVASLTASAAALNQWAKETLGLNDVALVDHSGLGDASRISAADMMTAMVAVRRRLGLKPLLKAFPMRDAQRNVIRDHPLSVHAKTGTLNFVSGLAGFVDLPDGRELAFAIFAANSAERDRLSKAERERPPGAADWNRRAKGLQQALIERWGVLYKA